MESLKGKAYKDPQNIVLITRLPVVSDLYKILHYIYYVHHGSTTTRMRGERKALKFAKQNARGRRVECAWESPKSTEKKLRAAWAR